MAIAVTEIAKRAGVSKATVSRYFNDRTFKIKPDTRKKIESAKAQLETSIISKHHTRKKLAHNFVAPINRTFEGSEGLVTSMFPVIAKHIEEILWEHHFRFSIVFFDVDKKYETVKDLIVSTDFCDGLLLLGGAANKEIAELIKENKIPHISLSPADENLGLNTVVAHSLLGIRQAIKHLIDLGHTRIGYVGMKQFYRYRYYVASLLENDVPFNEQLNIYLPPKELRESERRWREIAKIEFLKRLDSSPSATAYITQNDMIAFGVLDAMQEKGIIPGRNISIIGYDNLEERRPADDNISGLTTIDNPLDVIGKRAAELLLNQVFHRQTDIVHEHIPTKLIIRKTTGRYYGD